MDQFFDYTDNNPEIIPGGALPGKSSAKALNVIFVVDNSGSMRSPADETMTRLEAVNDAFRSVESKLQDKQREVGDTCEIFISIMAFNHSQEWIAKSEPIATYIHKDIPETPYVTYYGQAMAELDRQLSEKSLMKFEGKRAKPYIMFMTDGKPTKDDPYDDDLAELKKNGWFEDAQRYAVLIGKDTINDPEARQAVAGFVSSEKEGILTARDAEEIMENVSFKTMVVVDHMTRRPVQGGSTDDDNKTDGTDPAGTAVPDLGGWVF